MKQEAENGIFPFLIQVKEYIKRNKVKIEIEMDKPFVYNNIKKRGCRDEI